MDRKVLANCAEKRHLLGVYFLFRALYRRIFIPPPSCRNNARSRRHLATNSVSAAASPSRRMGLGRCASNPAARYCAICCGRALAVIATAGGRRVPAACRAGHSPHRRRARSHPEPAPTARAAPAAARRAAGPDRAAQRRSHPQLRGRHREFLCDHPLQLEQLLRHGGDRTGRGGVTRSEKESRSARPMKPRPFCGQYKHDLNQWSAIARSWGLTSCGSTSRPSQEMNNQRLPTRTRSKGRLHSQ